VGKRTIAVLLGKPAAIWGFRFCTVTALISIVVLVAFSIVHHAALIALITAAIAYQTDRMIRSTQDWKDLHDKGKPVRIFYLVNGLILILTVAYYG
jgi:1,4-dihydroxy-2-naphthoate octaprenyltransferase